MTLPAGGLPIAMDGPIGPIAIALAVGLVIARRRLAARELSDIAADTDMRASVDTASGRDRNLPRWLDPSVAAARFKIDGAVTPRHAVAAASVPARVPMVFTTPHDEVTPRLRVRYDGVPLLDRPDEALGRPLRELDGGDEVEVLDRAEIWAKVRTPSELIGWIPGMTLAAVVATAVEADPDTSDAVQLDLQAASDEPPALEALLEAIAAKRLPRQEPLVEAVPPPPRPRARKAKGEQPPARSRRPRQGTKTTRAEEP
jgi:hypothetical protein